jgi:hypothetical protein
MLTLLSLRIDELALVNVCIRKNVIHFVWELLSTFLLCLPPTEKGLFEVCRSFKSVIHMNRNLCIPVIVLFYNVWSK